MEVKNITKDTETLEILAEKVREGEEIAPKEFFDYVKGRKGTITDKELKEIYDNCLLFISKYNKTGQTKALKKLLLLLDRIEKERLVLKEGIDQFVYKDDLMNYISTICEAAKRQPVKLIELEKYEREIPDDVIEQLVKVKDKFDAFYILFTDYTGKVERQIKKEEIEKDPILFGVFMDKETELVVDRFYYIGDWEDEYCDLTLDRMVKDVKMVTGEKVVHEIPTYKDIEVMRAELADTDRNGQPLPHKVHKDKQPKKKSLMSKIFRKK